MEPVSVVVDEERRERLGDNRRNDRHLDPLRVLERRREGCLCHIREQGISGVKSVVDGVGCGVRVRRERRERHGTSDRDVGSRLESLGRAGEEDRLQVQLALVGFEGRLTAENVADDAVGEDLVAGCWSNTGDWRPGDALDEDLKAGVSEALVRADGVEKVLSRDGLDVVVGGELLASDCTGLETARGGQCVGECGQRKCDGSIGEHGDCSLRWKFLMVVESVLSW